MKFIDLIILIIFLANNVISAQPVIINEFLASNVTDTPEMQDFDDYTDWVELYNSSNEQVVLDEVFLTDDFDNPIKWKIPNGTLIAPEGYLVIWADDYDEGPGNVYTRPYWPWNQFVTQNFHTNFKLNKNGEELGLFKAEESGTIMLVEEGALWKYLDNGTNQGSEWFEVSYNDEDWNSGYAELGYGDGDEITVVGYGNDEDNKYTTTYFRHMFVATDTENI